LQSRRASALCAVFKPNRCAEAKRVMMYAPGAAQH
jgi:hypothetical protein